LSKNHDGIFRFFPGIIIGKADTGFPDEVLHAPDRFVAKHFRCGIDCPPIGGSTDHLKAIAPIHDCGESNAEFPAVFD
jgi:hypothetical protein